MNTYIVIGFGIGIAVVLFLLRVVFRKDKTKDVGNYQNISSNNFNPGSSMSNDEINVKIRELLSRENKIGAIKLLRDQRKISLLDAKNMVEAMEKNTSTGVMSDESYTKIKPFKDTAVTDSEVINQISVYLAQGNKINAIKYLVENKQMGLKEAKDYVDGIESKKS